jgi:putative two-component system response regulator
MTTPPPAPEDTASIALVIDDDAVTRALARELLKAEGCRVLEADNGLAGLEQARQGRPDFILLDVVMPGMDGYAVCLRIRETEGISDVPILMITRLDDRESRLKGLECGADDFLAKPIDATELRARVRTTLRLNRYRRTVRLAEELAIAYETTLEGWVRALDLRDRETEGHTQRVTAMTMRLAEAIGVPTHMLPHIRRGALLHDIGKIGIPDAILSKQGPLTPEERIVIQQHPVFGYQMLEPIAYLKPAIDIPWCHHERWDGKGYPRRLAGNEIPLAARVFAVVDVWDALLSDRPYHRGMTRESARKFLTANAGTQFDAMVVDLFLDLEENGVIDFGLPPIEDSSKV